LKMLQKSWTKTHQNVSKSLKILQKVMNQHAPKCFKTAEILLLSASWSFQESPSTQLLDNLFRICPFWTIFSRLEALKEDSSPPVAFIGVQLPHSAFPRRRRGIAVAAKRCRVSQPGLPGEPAGDCG
jgi:hypothetical protein